MKYWPYIIIMVLCVTAVYAGLSLTREEAIQELQTYKLQRENIITRITNQIQITSDKQCHVNYDTEDIDYCTICFKYPFPNTLGGYVNECRNYAENSTLSEDLNDIRTYVTRKVNEKYPMENFYYVKDSAEGTVISR